MEINSFLRIVFLLVLGFSSCSVSAASIKPFDTAAMFPKVAQGHHDNNSDTCHKITDLQLQIYGDGVINGTGGEALNYCSSNDQYSMSASSCDDGSGGKRRCTITGEDLRGYDSPNFMTSDKSGGSITTCVSGSIGSNGKTQFDALELYANCTLAMSATNDEYRFTKINIGSGVKLVLSAGDYWVDSFTLNSGASIVLQGNVRIFTNQNALFNGGKFNEDQNNSAIFLGYKNVELDSGALLNALVYSQESIKINNGSTINGRVTSRYLFISSGSVNDQMPAQSSQLDHFEIDYSSSPLTCKAENMQLRACANGDCSELFTDTFSANLSPNPVSNGAWYVAGTSTATTSVTFVNGVANVDLRHNVMTPITIDVSSASPAATSATLCRSGSGALSTAACTLAFAESGFIFDVPDKLAGKTQSVTISAVRKSNESLECVPTFSSQTKSVSFWSEFIDPVVSEMINPRVVTVNSTEIGNSSLTPTPLSLSFDASGKAIIDLNYADAGKIGLNAKFVGAAGSADEGLVMAGADEFVSFPVGLCIKPEVDDTGVCKPATNNDSGYAQCERFKKAGESFNLAISGRAWVSDSDDFCNNPSTPNYSHAGITLGSSVVAPADGKAGNVGLEKYDHLAKKDDNTQLISQSISEVGVFNFTAKPQNIYLGSSAYDIPLATSAPIGRFVPDRFIITTPSILPACENFTYLDQPFDASFESTAVNAASGITENYHNEFAKAEGLLVGEDSDNGLDLQARLNSVSLPLNWQNGIARVTYQAQFNRLPAVVGGEVDGPFNHTFIGLVLLDKDGDVTVIDSPDMNAVTTGDCGALGNCNAIKLSTSEQVFRHGRVVMENTYGPETETLTMPTRAEYWNGTIWAVSSDDSCTVASYPLALQNTDTAFGYRFEPELSAGQGVTRSASVATFAAGQQSLLWNSQSYRGQVTAPLDVPEWLEWYWNWNADAPTELFDPRASAFFGRYRGHDRIIYWREVN